MIEFLDSAWHYQSIVVSCIMAGVAWFLMIIIVYKTNVVVDQCPQTARKQMHFHFSYKFIINCRFLMSPLPFFTPQLLKYDRGNSSSKGGFWTFWSECSKFSHSDLSLDDFFSFLIVDFWILTIRTRCDYDVDYYLLI